MTSQGITKAKSYHLSYPNKEVRDSFLTYLLEDLLEDFSRKDMSFNSLILERINELIKAGAAFTKWCTRRMLEPDVLFSLNLQLWFYKKGVRAAYYK